MKKLLIAVLLLLPFAGQSQGKPSGASLSSLWKVVGTAGFTGGPAGYLSLVLDSSGIPYLAFKDYSHSGRATVMTFNGTQWMNVGTPGFSSGEVWFTSLATGTAGKLYVAYEDAANAFKATVMTFDGDGWVPAGLPGFTAGTANYTSLAVNPAAPGQPFVAFMDGAHGNKASVMMFDGSSWTYAGAPGFSAGEAEYVNLAFDPSGNPYVAFQDYAHSLKASVMKFSGTSWTYAGNAGFSQGPALFCHLSFNPAGEPHVAYWDQLVHGVVLKFNGTGWVNIGYPGFSAGEAHHTGLVFDQSGQAYVAFIDLTDYKFPKVVTYTPSGWSPVGYTGVSNGSADFTSLAMSPSGKLYIAFQDMDHASRATVKVFDSVYTGMNQPEKTTLRIRPNPACKSICIDLPPGCTASGMINVYRSDGVNILNAAFTGNQPCLETGNLPAGLYYLRIKTGSADYSGKFVRAVK